MTIQNSFKELAQEGLPQFFGNRRTLIVPGTVLFIFLVCLLPQRALWALDRGLDTLKQQAQRGESWAQFNLALRYYSGSDQKQNYPRAARWFREAALQGDERAQTNLAFMLEEGLGIKPNIDEALSWYLQAAQGGDTEAQFQLGLRFLHGRSVPRDASRGLRWIEFSAEQEHAQAQALLGDWYSLGAAEEKDGERYSQPDPESFSKGLRWYRRAARNQHSHAQYRLGLLLYLGRGIEVKMAEARDWLEKSAMQGHQDAQVLLGRFYSGASHRDLVRAYAWLSEAYSQGFEEAREALRVLETRLSATQLRQAREISSTLSARR